MQLKVRRNQRASMLGGKVIFTLDVMVGLDRDELALVERYKLRNEVVYSHSTADANAKAAQTGNLAARYAMIADRVMKKVLTIGDLLTGEHVECKDMNELLAVEEQVWEACRNIKKYLAVAESFDGHEVVLEVEQAA